VYNGDGVALLTDVVLCRSDDKIFMRHKIFVFMWSMMGYRRIVCVCVAYIK